MDIERLLLEDGESVKTRILNTDKETRLELLKDDRIKEFFFSEENHYPFIWLTDYLNEEELRVFFNKYSIELLLQNNRVIDKLNVIINFQCDFKDEILADDRIIEKIISSEDLLLYASNIGGKCFDKLFEISIKNNNLNLLKRLNPKLVVSRLDDNILKSINYEKNKYVILKMDSEIVNIFMNCIEFQKLFEIYDAQSINNLISNGVDIPEELYSVVIKKYLAINDISEYRAFVDNVNRHNIYLGELLEKKKHEQYDNMIHNINNGMFNKYQKILNGEEKINDQDYTFMEWKMKNNSNLKEEFINRTDTQILEMICDKYFGDYTTNVLFNIQELVSFCISVKENIISKENLIIYNTILQFKNLSLEDKIKFYDSIPLDMQSLFYDDYRKCQNYIVELINKEIPSLENLRKEQKENFEYYVLDGEDFVMPVHSTGSNMWLDSKANKTLSISLIGNECLGTFKNLESSTLIGFKSLNPKSILHMYNSDSFTSKEYSTKRVNKLYTPHELLKNTRSYNEILIDQRIYEYSEIPLKPSFIICYDLVTDKDIYISQKFKLPLIMVNTKKYNPINSAGLNPSDDDKYVTGYYDIPSRKKY